MKIGVISDTHDRCDYIDRFLARFESESLELLLHLGDVVAPFAAKRFAAIARRVPFVALFGNNDGERAGLTRIVSEWGSIGDGPKRLELGGRIVIASHYPMAPAEVLANWPDADYHLSGHTHVKSDATHARPDGGRLRLINPGEACGWVEGVATAGVLEPDRDLYRELGVA